MLTRPPTNFASHLSPRLPMLLQAAQTAITEATLELHDLIRGPRSLPMDISNQFAARPSIARFDITFHVPAEEGSIFSEPEPGRIAHSATSKLLREVETMRAFCRANTDFFHLVLNVATMLEQLLVADDPTYTAASIAAGTIGEKGFCDAPNRSGRKIFMRS